ncbi:hypothetical protein HGRIS_013052 [Hohenbuehelia grisea]|uniref:GrpE protein homolog, mitochondrial n=1 Tax=Hohenbuehelia grisea TaxID=104357 RepID=A0ABR3IUF8_9AGAR
MSFAQASRLFRSCTTSLSSRALARPSLPVAARHYSAEATETPAAEPKEKDGEKTLGKVVNPLEAKLKAKEEEVVDLTGRLRYLQADFLNLQRNAAREKEQTRDFAITRFASDLLETVDVLFMAMKSIPQTALSPPSESSRPAETSAPSSAESSSSATSPPTKTAEEYLRELHEGVELTQRQLLQTLFKYHVKPFDPTGDVFDPNRHEALYQAPVPGKTPGTVIDCQKTGYTIKDRILRAAQVGVAQETQS